MPAKLGTRYMVVDCGGGTVDITVHEMEQKGGKLKELYKATGGPYGSVGERKCSVNWVQYFTDWTEVHVNKIVVGVDLKFEEVLCAIFGKEFIDQFRHKRPVGWVDLMIAFESRKRAASPFKQNPLNVALPFSFIDCYKKMKVGVSNSKKHHNWVCMYYIMYIRYTM